MTLVDPLARNKSLLFYFAGFNSSVGKDIISPFPMYGLILGTNSGVLQEHVGS